MTDKKNKQGGDCAAAHCSSLIRGAGIQSDRSNDQHISQPLITYAVTELEGCRLLLSLGRRFIKISAIECLIFRKHDATLLLIYSQLRK